jgi:hypothetical protein
VDDERDKPETPRRLNTPETRQLPHIARAWIREMLAASYRLK